MRFERAVIEAGRAGLVRWLAERRFCVQAWREQQFCLC